jgi:hypothetical protein
MAPRSPFRTNGVACAVVGLMITLLLHFVLLSSPRFNWINPLTVTIPMEPAALVQELADKVTLAIAYFTI